MTQTPEQIVASLTTDEIQAVKDGNVSNCVYNHPAGTRCPVCSGWPFAKGGAEKFRDDVRAILKEQTP